ncbi:hypothetical protein B0H15DRAFT_1023711 [Mycena belliarum]|uniref:Uncharacterized protein n=1 Tax=Mycena belliarum TaxID=1033014 RepID=A0AAD6U102_9AGAR|nr:hypothetical protein B0H15DRAFT_1023711 [Mycena belliae]
MHGVEVRGGVVHRSSNVGAGNRRPFRTAGASAATQLIGPTGRRASPVLRTSTPTLRRVRGTQRRSLGTLSPTRTTTRNKPSPRAHRRAARRRTLTQRRMANGKGGDGVRHRGRRSRASALAASAPAAKHARRIPAALERRRPSLQRLLGARTTCAESDYEQHRRKSPLPPPPTHRARSVRAVCNVPRQCRPRIRGMRVGVAHARPTHYALKVRSRRRRALRATATPLRVSPRWRPVTYTSPPISAPARPLPQCAVSQHTLTACPLGALR